MPGVLTTTLAASAASAAFSAMPGSEGQAICTGN